MSGISVALEYLISRTVTRAHTFQKYFPFLRLQGVRWPTNFKLEPSHCEVCWLLTHFKGNWMFLILSGLSSRMQRGINPTWRFCIFLFCLEHKPSRLKWLTEARTPKHIIISSHSRLTSLDYIRDSCLRWIYLSISLPNFLMESATHEKTFRSLSPTSGKHAGTAKSWTPGRQL